MLRFFSVRNRKFWDFTVWFDTQKLPAASLTDDDTCNAQAPNIFQARLGEEGQDVKGQILGTCFGGMAIFWRSLRPHVGDEHDISSIKTIRIHAVIGDSAQILVVLVYSLYICSCSCCQLESNTWRIMNGTYSLPAGDKQHPLSTDVFSCTFEK